MRRGERGLRSADNRYRDIFLQDGIGNAEGGGVVLWADFPEGSSPPTNHLSLIQPDDTVEEIWSYKAETDDMGYSFYELVWARPMPDEGDFPPFVAIQ